MKLTTSSYAPPLVLVFGIAAWRITIAPLAAAAAGLPDLPMISTMKKCAFASIGLLALTAGVIWWLMDDRRGVAWAVGFVRFRFRDVTHLSIEALSSWLRDARRGAPQLLDVRSKDEFGVSHLPGAMRVDYRAPLRAGSDALDPARPIVVYCSAGYRSSIVARKLQEAGFAKILNLEGGIFAWANAGLPLERDGQPASAVHPCLRLFSRMVKPRMPPTRRI